MLFAGFLTLLLILVGLSVSGLMIIADAFNATNQSLGLAGAGVYAFWLPLALLLVYAFPQTAGFLLGLLGAMIGFAGITQLMLAAGGGVPASAYLTPWVMGIAFMLLGRLLYRKGRDYRSRLHKQFQGQKMPGV